ncbi:hypothetical protein CFC21_025987 [Triticum aestivum]|uniref:Uncharacterized protein n=3 Tax=Triticum TaxID=4564 RepID=A0A9R1Q0P6_TRITD|nr:hypothetical protein CFC21_025987 [Triticum aestivum]VAH53190.1 unnamed protein product [Triticum turgidum subsp. durum]
MNKFTMCSDDGTSHIVLPRAAPGYAGSKRTLAMYDPAAAQQRADAARLSADVGALVPSPVGVAGEPIKAVPLAAAAPKERAEPPGIRAPKDLLAHLSLRLDLPVHFIDEKTVTATDVDPQQNRFRLPIDGVIRNLRPVLSHLDRQAANLVHVEAPRPRLPKLPKVPGEKTKKRRGREHGGLPVLVIECYAGIRELQLTRWESSGVCVIKGEGYMDFINNCSFSVGDVVEIWAFKQKALRLFGVDIYEKGYQESPLCVLFIKKDQILPPSHALVVSDEGEETAQDHAS